MEKFKSEVLSSGIRVDAVEGKSYDFLLKSDYGQWMKLTRSDINRLHGISFPEKRRSGVCENRQELPVANPHGDDDHGEPMNPHSQIY